MTEETRTNTYPESAPTGTETTPVPVAVWTQSAPAHVMVDLETLGTEPYSPVVAIGAVRFTMDGDRPHFDDLFYQPITLESNMELGLRPSASTICWWLQQSEEARSLFAHNQEGAAKLPNALDEFIQWFQSRPDTVWGNSARFDCGLLEAAFKACNKEVPWAFYRESCYRTMKGLPGIKGVVELERHGTHHNALDDALSQAMHLRRIYKKLGMA